MERLQRDMVILQHRLEETKKEQDTKDPKLTNDVIANNQVPIQLINLDNNKVDN